MIERYVAAGVRADCRTLLNAFSKLKTLRYNEFAKVWRDMKFSYIYCERKSFDELVEFTEEVLRIAKELWLKSSELHMQVGGLYMVYGLYLKQPTVDLVKIRLSSEEIDKLSNIHNELRRGLHHDANFILAKLIYMGAFHFCATTYVHGLEKKYRRYFEKDRSLAEGQDEPPSYATLMSSSEFIKKMDDTFKEYHATKCKLTESDTSVPPQILAYADPNVANMIREKIEEIEKSVQVSTESDADIEYVSQPGPSSSTVSSNVPWWLRKGTSFQRYSHPTELSSSDDDDIYNEKN